MSKAKRHNDTRYALIKPLITTRDITTLNDLFKVIPKTVVAINLGIGGDRFRKMLDSVDKFNAGKLFKLAELVGVDEMKIMELLCASYLIQKKNFRRKQY